MNIKTTIIMLVLLLGVGAAVYFTRDKETPDAKPTVHTLVDVKSTDVTRFVIVGSDGKTIAAQKSNDAGGLAVWKMTQPVSAALDSFKVSSLLDSLTSLKSTAQLNMSDAPKTALDKPQYTVDLYEGPKDTKLTIGDPVPVAGGVYVKIDGHDTVDVVSNSVVDSLDKPASDLRKTQLFETASPSVQQLTITHADGSEMVLEKMPKGWQMVKPTTMPAEQSSVEDLVSAVVNMTPVEFVDEPSPIMGLKNPQATVTFSTVPSSTQPTTQPAVTPMPGGVTVLLGGYDGVQMKNVFAQLPDGSVVKVAASVLDSMNKKPFELRDKTVADLDPATMSKVVIEMNQPATTQPTTMPAVATSTVLIRKHKAATKPVIGPTLATTSPAPPAGSDWEVSGAKSVDADDAKVTAMLGHFHPLKAESYLEKISADKMVKIYKLTLFPSNVEAVVATFADPGGDRDLICSYNGLPFAASRSVLTDLSADFVKPAAK
jgi:hypothetical protein